MSNMVETKCNCPDCTFPKCDCWADKNKIPLIKRHKYLGKFYGVDSYDKLVDIQSTHIERLQKKLPPLKDDQPRKCRA